MGSGEEIQRAVQILRRGGLVGLPTETVYGLAADAENELAVRRIFAVKGRPSSHPLIVHVASAAKLEGWVARVPDEARRLADAFWPGPLTIVLPRGPRAKDVVTGGQDTVALRVPGHPLARELLEAFGGGLAAPSANRFGRVSPTRAEHVRADLGSDVELVLDGGASAVGLESTIVDLSGDGAVLLRPGGISREQLERVLGKPLSSRKSEVRAPGTLESHYAPAAGVVLASADEAASRAQALAREGRKVALVAPEHVSAPSGVEAIRVSDDPAEFAHSLYATLRELDVRGFDVAVVVVPSDDGIGLAVRDRLTRAAAPRE
jgi:L-threonylcarbamoyladenylate synthase